MAKELINRGIVAFDIDTVEGLCHWRNRNNARRADYQPGIGKDWIEAHEWICDVEKLEKLLTEHGDTVVAVGIASNQDKYLYLFDKIFLLHCSEEIFLQRLTMREGDNEFAKDPSEQQQILTWYKDFEKHMLEQGAIPINTEAPLSEVVDKIFSEIRSYKN